MIQSAPSASASPAKVYHRLETGGHAADERIIILTSSISISFDTPSQSL